MRKIVTMFLCTLLMCSQLMAQNRTITGKVTDSRNGSPVVGASVVVKGNASGTQTNDAGVFTISVPASARTLVFSYVGFATQEISIGSRTSVDVSLSTDDKVLSEVVVVGYQTLSRKDVTGSVATVSGEEVSQKPIGSVTQLLQGKATGVQVTGQTGRPGANAFIRIRGAGSINASSEPLIILDGVPITSAAYNMINPNDIESFNILKDAASASIYGARGANGVIVITSKKGKGRAELQYSFQYGVANRQELKNVRLMDSREKLQYEFEANYTNGILDSMITNRKASGALPATATLFNITDAQRQDLWNLTVSRGANGWEKYLFQDAITRTHSVSLSSNTDKFRYYFSLNKSDNDGIIYGSYWNRTSARLNIEYNANDWFKIGTNFGVTHTKENQVREPYNTQNANAGLYLINPYEPLYLTDGKTYNPTLQGLNPLEGTDFNPQLLQRIAAFTTLFGEAKFFNHLTLRTQLGINYNVYNEEYYIMGNSNLANILGYNQKRVSGNQDFLYVFTNTANWRQTFGSDHNLSVLVGTEFNKDKVYNTSMTARGFPTPSVNTLDNASTPFATTTSRSDWSLISYFANVTYDFKKKYYVTLSGRRDGSSRFGRDVKFANFGGVGLAWDVLSEDFFKWDALNELRLRASYGTAGNNNIGNYDALGTYALNARYNNIGAAIPSRLPNPELTWESNENYDFGMDLAFFQSRLTAKVDYYNRKTKNLLYPVNVSSTTGFASYTGNIGSLVNKGFEIEVGGDIIRTKDLIWNVSVSYSNNDNKVTQLYNDNQLASNTYSLAKLKVGEPVNVFNLVPFAGVNPANGKNRYVKKDGTITETFPTGEAIIYSGKSPNVKYFGSINTQLSYKGFDLSAQLYYSGGNYIMNYMWQTGANNGEDPSIPQFVEALDYWKKAGDVKAYPNLKDPTQYATYDDDRWLQKGDYITLRDVTIGYTMKPEMLQKLKFIKGLRIYAQGTNLWVGTKYKGIPEVGYSNGESTAIAPGIASLYAYPQLRAFTFGVDVKF